MSENNVQYDNFPSVNKYVEEQFKQWQEIYDISYEDVFNVKLLLQLRYDILHTKPEYTKTKLELIEMSNRIQSRLRLKPVNNQYETILYVDFIYGEGNKSDKVIVYKKEKMYIIQNENYKIQDYANIITNMRNENETFTIFIDTHGFGQSLYDALYEKPAIDVRRVTIQNWNR